MSTQTNIRHKVPTFPPMRIAAELYMGATVLMGDEAAFINATPVLDAYGLIKLQYRYHYSTVEHTMRVRPNQPFDFPAMSELYPTEESVTI